MKIPFEQRITWLIKNMEHSANNSLMLNRYAGALEVCLQELDVIGEKLPEYKKGGKCYIPYILDFRWQETYSQMILRVAKEYECRKLFWTLKLYENS